MTSPAPTTPADTLELFGAAYLRTAETLANVGDAQWRAGHTPRPVQDTTERSRGTTSDPTWHAVSDPRRQALRAAVIEAERAMRQAEDALSQALAILERSHRSSPEATESESPS